MTTYIAKESILETRESSANREHEIKTDTTGDSIAKIINLYFEKFREPVDFLSYSSSMRNRFSHGEPGTSSKCEDPQALPQLKSAIAGRPLQVKLLFEEDCMIPNCPTAIFLREYIDYKMFVCNMKNGHSVELNDKMINCEFLSLKCDVRNPERLMEFRGWGLALEEAEKKGYDFDFFCKVFEDWYSGKPIQFRYLGLECSVDIEKWKRMCSLGTEKVYEEGFKHFEIVREDGTICRIQYDEYYRDPVKRTKVIFYLGERTFEIDVFNMEWKPCPLINSGY